MRRFCGKPDASTLLLPGVIFLLLSLLLVPQGIGGVLGYQNQDKVGGLFGQFLQFAVTVLIGAYSIHEIRKYIDAFATYTVDAGGILRWSRLGTQKMHWSHITWLEIDGSTGAVSALRDDNSRNLAIKYRYLSQQDANDLQRILDANLAPLRAHLLQEKVMSRHTCHCDHGIAGMELVLYGFVMSVATTVLGNTAVLSPFGPSLVKSTGNVLFLLLVDVLAFLGVLHALYKLTYTVSLSNGELREQSLFTKKRVGLNHIAAVTTESILYRRARIKRTTIEGGGNKIPIHAGMTNYGLLRDFLYAQAQKCGARVTIQP